ncbi:MAG: T9SS type A sorting domain-containing protein [Crocinitomicaceae bacterium]|nr:T9SS type A sorting domain-containing protein [Crocinitomicaceae bacterium]
MKEIILSLVLLFSTGDSFASMWIKRADFGAQGRHRATGISIGNKGYMGLGHFNGAGPNIILKDWWQYDPGTNSWSQKADYIGNNGNGTYAVLAFGMDKYGYIGGGQVASTTAFYRYDPVTNSWSQVAASPTLPVNTKGFVIGDKGYYLDGNAVYEYNSTNNVWTSKNFAPFSINIWNSTFTIDNKGYVKTNTGLWEYKPTIDQWASRAPFPGLSSAGGVGFTHRNKGYVVCGYGVWLSDLTSEVWEYDPATNLWTIMPEFPGSSRRFCSGFTIGDRAYFGIGTNGTNFSDLWEFSVLADLEEIFDETKFAVYPNPAVESINFRSENLNTFNLDVFDALGNHIHSRAAENGHVQMTRQNLPSGNYFYQVQLDGKIVHSDHFIFN